MRVLAPVTSVALVALSLGSIEGQAPPGLPTFEVASVRPTAPESDDGQRLWGQGNGLVILREVTLHYVIREAFGLHDFQVSGPDWIKTERYDILATAPAGTTRPVILQMMQALIRERFQMTSHVEIEEAPIYTLTLRPGGPPLRDVLQENRNAQTSEVGDASISKNRAGEPTFNVNDPVLGRYHVTPLRFGTHYEFDAISAAAMERMLNQSYLDRPVVNRTSLGGAYALTLDVPFPSSVTGNSDPTGYSVEESLKNHGLQLNRERGVVETLVIDRISKEPTAN